MAELNILFTSAGRRTYLINYFREALKGEGIAGAIHAANSAYIAPAMVAADRFVLTPLSHDMDYISFLLNYCQENNIAAIISLLDTDAAVLSNYQDVFARHGVALIISKPSTIEICNDKYKTYVFLKRNNIETPTTFLTIKEAVNAVDQGKVDYPLMVKPRWGTGSIAVYDAYDKRELEILYRKVKTKVLSSFLKYESESELDKSVVIQEHVEGEEYGLDVINDLEGNYRNTIVKKKLVMRSGETDCACVVRLQHLEDIGKCISDILRHNAILDVDVFMRQGKPVVLEMNARFGGGYPFSHAAGVDVPRAIVRWLLGEEVDSQLLTPRINVLAQKNISMLVYGSQIAELAKNNGEF